MGQDEGDGSLIGERSVKWIVVDWRWASVGRVSGVGRETEVGEG